MRHAFLAALTAPLALGALPAVAADFASRPPPPVDYYTPAPVSRWQGFYAGLNGGYGWGSFTYGGQWLFDQPTGGEFGFTAGYNYMVTPNLLIGAEADFDFAGINVTSYPFPGLVSSSSVNDLFTLRGRVGYTMDRALFFVSGGLAGGRTDLNLQNSLGKFLGSAVQLSARMDARRRRRISRHSQCLGESRISVHVARLQPILQLLALGPPARRQHFASASRRQLPLLRLLLPG